MNQVPEFTMVGYTIKGLNRLIDRFGINPGPSNQATIWERPVLDALNYVKDRCRPIVYEYVRDDQLLPDELKLHVVNHGHKYFQSCKPPGNRFFGSIEGLCQQTGVGFILNF